MILGAVSGVQWWTLGVAGAAVVASITGIVFNALFSRRSEHAVWQRDLRLRIYGECATTLDALWLALDSHATVYRKYLEKKDNDDDVKERHQIVAQLMTKLMNLVEEVGTFGSNAVGEVAFETLTICTRAINDMYNKSAEEQQQAIDAVLTSAFALRNAVRDSLGISDD
jgi:hypothetical protein